jgi:hypothetical protein
MAAQAGVGARNGVKLASVGAREKALLRGMERPSILRLVEVRGARTAPRHTATHRNTP